MSSLLNPEPRTRKDIRAFALGSGPGVVGVCLPAPLPSLSNCDAIKVTQTLILSFARRAGPFERRWNLAHHPIVDAILLHHVGVIPVATGFVVFAETTQRKRVFCVD